MQPVQAKSDCNLLIIDLGLSRIGDHVDCSKFHSSYCRELFHFWNSIANKVNLTKIFLCLKFLKLFFRWTIYLSCVVSNANHNITQRSQSWHRRRSQVRLWNESRDSFSSCSLEFPCRVSCLVELNMKELLHYITNLSFNNLHQTLFPGQKRNLKANQFLLVVFTRPWMKGCWMKRCVINNIRRTRKALS